MKAGWLRTRAQEGVSRQPLPEAAPRRFRPLGTGACVRRGIPARGSRKGAVPGAVRLTQRPTEGGHQDAM